MMSDDTRRGGRVVMQRLAKPSPGNRREGSSPSPSVLRSTCLERTHDGPSIEDGMRVYWRTLVNVHGIPPIDVVRFVTLDGRRELGYWQHSHEYDTRSLAIWTKHRGTAAVHQDVTADQARTLVARYHRTIPEEGA